jgi:hypothetical protein
MGQCWMVKHQVLSQPTAPVPTGFSTPEAITRGRGQPPPHFDHVSKVSG